MATHKCNFLMVGTTVESADDFFTYIKNKDINSIKNNYAMNFVPNNTVNSSLPSEYFTVSDKRKTSGTKSNPRDPVSENVDDDFFKKLTKHAHLI